MTADDLAAPETARLYPPEPTTDGSDHAHDPEVCAACRRRADQFFDGGVQAERTARRIDVETLAHTSSAAADRRALLAEVDRLRERVEALEKAARPIAEWRGNLSLIPEVEALHRVLRSESLADRAAGRAGEGERRG